MLCMCICMCPKGRETGEVMLANVLRVYLHGPGYCGIFWRSPVCRCDQERMRRVKVQARTVKPVWTYIDAYPYIHTACSCTETARAPKNCSKLANGTASLPSKDTPRMSKSLAFACTRSVPHNLFGRGLRSFAVLVLASNCMTDCLVACLTDCLTE